MGPHNYSNSIWEAIGSSREERRQGQKKQKNNKEQSEEPVAALQAERDLLKYSFQLWRSRSNFPVAAS